MPSYQEMPEDELRAILEANEKTPDELAAAKKAQEAFIRNTPCTRCGGACVASFPGVRMVFPAGSVLPNYTLTCRSCGAEFDPHTGILLRLGNIGRACEIAMAQQTPWINPESDSD